GEALQGNIAPPLTGDDFVATWSRQPLSELIDKIHSTMPANRPGTLSRGQAADLAAHILQVSKFPSGTSELASDEAALKLITWPGVAARPAATPGGNVRSFPPAGNLAQMMRGMLFPSSNLIFNVQTNDPGRPVKPVDVSSDARVGFSW